MIFFRKINFNVKNWATGKIWIIVSRLTLNLHCISWWTHRIRSITRIVRFLWLPSKRWPWRVKGRRGHGLNADNASYAVARRRYTSSKCVRNCWWFVVVPLHVIRGPSSTVVTRVIMRRRIRGDVIRRAVILKLPDDHKTVPIEIYHLGAYYRRASPRGWKQRRVERQWAGSSMIISRRHLAALTLNHWLPRSIGAVSSSCICFFFFNTTTIPLMMPLHKLVLIAKWHIRRKPSVKMHCIH